MNYRNGALMPLIVSLVLTHLICWEKLLFKVMHYSIALLKKNKLIALISYFLWKVTVTFAFSSGLGLLACFNYKTNKTKCDMSYFWQM